MIVGGSAAGITVAITARRYYPEAKIVIIRKEKKVLIPCGIPYIFGTLGSVEKNLIPDTMLSKNKIELVIDEVTSINKGTKTVATISGKTIGYERMILATGSLPLIPPVSGVDLGNVFTVKKDVDYLQRLSQALNQAKDVVIIGGGFVGLEFADECKKKGIPNVTVVELLPHCLLLACDEEICMRVESKLLERGVKVLADRKAKAILGDGKVQYVELENGQKLRADVVILGIGVTPDVRLAEKAGLEVEKRMGIWVDEFMRTSDKNIFAIGDCAQKRCYLSGMPSNVRLASIAATEARIAGGNLFAIQRRSYCAIGIFSTMIGDLGVGSAGLTERSAKELGIEVVTGEFIAPNKHPGCMPGTEELGVKLIFEKDTMVLIGGQVYGGPTTGEMINFIGALIQHEMRAYEITIFQIGTHPMLTASPIAYQIVNAAEIALAKRR